MSVLQASISHGIIIFVQFYMFMYLFTLYNKTYSYTFEYFN